MPSDPELPIPPLAVNEVAVGGDASGVLVLCAACPPLLLEVSAGGTKTKEVWALSGKVIVEEAAGKKVDVAAAGVW